MSDAGEPRWTCCAPSSVMRYALEQDAGQSEAAVARGGKCSAIEMTLVKRAMGVEPLCWRIQTSVLTFRRRGDINVAARPAQGLPCR